MSRSSDGGRRAAGPRGERDAVVKIAVLMGGRSLEREVSLKSGERVTAALSHSGYRVIPLDITDDLVPRLRSEKPDAVFPGVAT